MFRFWKKAKMIAALDTCQKYHRGLDLDQELTEAQLEGVRGTRLFNVIASKYKSRGMSEWGGLAWFCGDFTYTIFKKIDQGEPISQNTQEVAEKLACVSITIAASMSSLKLTQEDMRPIEFAAEVASRWAHNTPFAKELKQNGYL